MTITETVTKKLRLFSRRKVVTLLSGNYDSLFRGRGLEIDTLREYVSGDDVKDIDWKATARTNVVHTRMYAALRDQRVIVVADTSRSMLLEGYTSLNKQDAVYAVCVMLGAFVKRNQDLLALCSAEPSGKVTLSRFKNTSRHLESMLHTIDGSLHAPQNQNVGLEVLGQQLLGVTKKRSAVFIVSDGTPDVAELKTTINKMIRRHQVFYVQLAPSWPFAKEMSDEFALQDIETGGAMSPDLAVNTQLKQEWQAAFTNWSQSAKRICQTHGVPYGLITDAQEVPDVLRAMFIQAKRYAARRR